MADRKYVIVIADKHNGDSGTAIIGPPVSIQEAKETAAAIERSSAYACEVLPCFDVFDDAIIRVDTEPIEREIAELRFSVAPGAEELPPHVKPDFDTETVDENPPKHPGDL